MKARWFPWYLPDVVKGGHALQWSDKLSGHKRKSLCAAFIIGPAAEVARKLETGWTGHSGSRGPLQLGAK